MQKEEIEMFCPTNQEDWRKWLTDNHNSKQSVWLVCYKMSAGKPSISWSNAVNEALCFGWIDSIRKTIDNEKFMQFFGKRKPSSGWSKINKEKVEQLIAEGRMMEAGYESIKTAKQNGSWTILDDVEELKIPEDLEVALKTKAGSADFFFSLSKSVRKAMLQWVTLAKRPETRQNRIAEIVTLAAQKLKPKQF
jgi:uncharacterized protein YdeI (YjbR/CyaY-like superfamily)